jgi:hypothetical protein
VISYVVFLAIAVPSMIKEGGATWAAILPTIIVAFCGILGGVIVLSAWMIVLTLQERRERSQF